ncbi:MAG: hypothetical protein JRE40_04630 [Deltaproteobacteria bacterium]|nr:hypothetical protein [Deltaproteobacteria bacterium]
MRSEDEFVKLVELWLSDPLDYLGDMLTFDERRTALCRLVQEWIDVNYGGDVDENLL